MGEIVVGISGASGAIYGQRLTEVLSEMGRQVRLIVTDSGRLTLKHECDNTPEALAEATGAILEDAKNVGAKSASGSAKIDAVVICPCSGTTIGKLAAGISDNLVTRSAIVAMKERRKLIIVPREAPYATVHLENMAKLSAWDTIIVPASPGFYNHPRSIDDLIDFTPELRAEAEEILDDYVYGPMFTPPTVRGVDGKRGTILMPGWVGGANWGGAAVDPETGMMFIPSVTSPNVTALVPPPLPDSSDHRYIRGLPREVPMPSGLPLLKPPYGRITAIDMNDGEHAWMKANGPGPRDHPAIADLDLPWLGQRGRPAPLLTRSLLFIGEGTEDALSILPIAGGKAFRAWDKQTGEVVWEMDLPAGTSGAPMTYLADGRQFIVVAIGDRDTTGRLVALALPQAGR